MAAAAQKPAMPAPARPRPTPAQAKNRPGGCITIAVQKGRIAKGKARAKGGKIGGTPSAMKIVKKLGLDVYQMTVGIAAFMDSLIGSMFSFGRGYVPIIETAQHRANEEAFERVARRQNAPVLSPSGFAASYAAQTGGSGGGVEHKRQVTAPVPVPAPRPSDSAETKRIQAKAQERFGNGRAYSALAAYFAIALNDPEKATNQIRQELPTTSFSDELKLFLMHPNRSDVKKINDRISAVAKVEKCSREEAVTYMMDTIEETARTFSYHEKQRLLREQMKPEGDEGDIIPPAGTKPI